MCIGNTCIGIVAKGKKGSTVKFANRRGQFTCGSFLVQMHVDDHTTLSPSELDQIAGKALAIFESQVIPAASQFGVMPGKEHGTSETTQFDTIVTMDNHVYMIDVRLMLKRPGLDNMLKELVQAWFTKSELKENLRNMPERTEEHYWPASTSIRERLSDAKDRAASKLFAGLIKLNDAVYPPAKRFRQHEREINAMQASRDIREKEESQLTEKQTMKTHPASSPAGLASFRPGLYQPHHSDTSVDDLDSESVPVG